MTRGVPPKKSKAPAIIGVIAIVAVIGIIGAVFSGTSSDPESASWEDVVRAHDGKVGDWMVEHFRKVRREDPRAFDREIEARRDRIKASGLSVQDYGEKNRKVEERQAALSEQRQRDEAALATLKEEHEKRADDLDARSEALKKEAFQIRLYRLDRDSEEYRREKKRRKDMYARAKDLRQQAQALRKEMDDKVEALRSKYDAELRAYKDELGWHPENW